MAVVNLKQACEHGRYDEHDLPFTVNSNVEELRAVNHCPGGTLLPPDTLDLLETAWGIIANAGHGDWANESETWKIAAVRWRDRYHVILDALAAAQAGDR